MAWPTVLQNAIGGLQGIIDHAMVGHYVGFTGNAAIGVSWQIFLVVIVFIASLFTGMGVLVARFAGANEPDKVNRTVYQAFLTALVLSLGVLAPLGYVLSPTLLDLVNATPAVKAEALPFLRTMFVFSIGMLLFFMLGGALRAAGDARTPLRLGICMTVLNVAFNVVLIPGLRAGAGVRHARRRDRHGVGEPDRVVDRRLAAAARPAGRALSRRRCRARPDWSIIRSLFKFGLPAGHPGRGDERRRRDAAALHRVAAAQRRSAGGVRRRLRRAVRADHVDVGRPDGQPRRRSPARISAPAIPSARSAACTIASRIGIARRGDRRRAVRADPGSSCSAIFGLDDPTVVALGRQLLRFLCVSGFFITVALTYTGGLQGTGDTRSPLYITLVSQVLVPLGICGTLQSLGRLDAAGVWSAIVLGHFTRCCLSVLRFKQGKWRHIVVE